MPQKRVLIVSISGDLHADIVGEKINALGQKVFRINIDEFPRNYDVTVNFVGQCWRGDIVHRPTQESICADDIGAIWVRKKGDFSYSSELGKQERTFADGEMEHFLFGLLNSIECYWMSHPAAIRKSMWKLEQLARADRMGFRVPASISSNDPAAIRAFKADSCSDILFKTLSSATLAAELVDRDDVVATGLATTLITYNNEDELEAVSELPSFFQEYIPKSHELRITIIGDKVFAARIDSQADERTRIDCRDFSADIAYDVAELPEEFERKCLDFVHSYGLTFGALDVIVTPDRDYVFLENNPVGQFYFIEELIPAFPLTEVMARQLHKMSGLSSETYR